MYIFWAERTAVPSRTRRPRSCWASRTTPKRPTHGPSVWCCTYLSPARCPLTKVAAMLESWRSRDAWSFHGESTERSPPKSEVLSFHSILLVFLFLLSVSFCFFPELVLTIRVDLTNNGGRRRLFDNDITSSGTVTVIYHYYRSPRYRRLQLSCSRVDGGTKVNL